MKFLTFNSGNLLELLSELGMFDFENASLNFLATLAGVLLAFGLALWDDRRKRRQVDRDTQVRIAKAIHLELQSNLQFVKESKGKGILSTLFPVGAYQSAVSSGGLSLFVPEMQRSLDIVYTEFRVVELFGARVLSMAGSADMRIPEFSQNFASFNKLVDNQLSELEKTLPSLIQSIEADLEQLKS